MMSTTVTFRTCPAAPTPATTTHSSLLRDSTSILNLLIPLRCNSIGEPTVGAHALGQQEDLHHRAGSKDLHDGARGRLDLRRCAAYVHAGDPLDLFPQGT